MKTTEETYTEAYEYALDIIDDVEEVFGHENTLTTLEVLIGVASYEFVDAGFEPDDIAELLRRELYRYRSQLNKESGARHD